MGCSSRSTSGGEGIAEEEEWLFWGCGRGWVFEDNQTDNQGTAALWGEVGETGK